MLARAAERGWRAIRLVRRAAATDHEVSWWPEEGRIDQAALQAAALEAVVHLAGESVFGWWSRAKRRRIVASRVDATRLLVDALGQLEPRPRVLASASAVGFYGDAGDAEVDESSPLGRGFLSEVCRGWEEQALRAEAMGIRTVLLRIGVVLSPTGGALAAMRPIFRLGLGGPVAGGRPWVPWISLDDTVGAIEHVMAVPDLRGPVNIVGPSPARQGELARAVAARLHRPAIVPVPRWAASALLGEMARETALKSVRAVPRRLLETGYRFRHASLEAALDAAMKPQSGVTSAGGA